MYAHHCRKGDTSWHDGDATDRYGYVAGLLNSTPGPLGMRWIRSPISPSSCSHDIHGTCVGCCALCKVLQASCAGSAEGPHKAKAAVLVTPLLSAEALLVGACVDVPYLHDRWQAVGYKAQVFTTDEHVTGCHDSRQCLQCMSSPQGIMTPADCTADSVIV